MSTQARSGRRSPGLVVAGLLLIVIGAVWTAQGLGYLPGSAMTGVALWAVAGPVVALGGVALAVRGWFGRRQKSSDPLAPDDGPDE